MAEAAGLAVGAVALVSLFQTTVELLEYFEAARTLASDGELAATKLSLLEARLRQWGDDLHVQHPGKEDGGLRKCWEDEGGLVTKSLEAISETLGNASQLREKYGLHKRRRLQVVWHSSIPSMYPILQRTETAISCSRKSYKISPSIHRQAVWAIKDKKRFESLICDLDFFITNLEKVSGRLLKLELAQSEKFTVSTMASNNTNSDMSNLAAERHTRRGYPTQTETTPASGNTPNAPASAPGKGTHHSFEDMTISGEAFQPLGDIDNNSDHKHKYQNIHTSDFAFAPCGNTTSEGLLKLLEQHQKGHQNNENRRKPQPSHKSESNNED